MSDRFICPHIKTCDIYGWWKGNILWKRYEYPEVVVKEEGIYSCEVLSIRKKKLERDAALEESKTSSIDSECSHIELLNKLEAINA